MQDAAIQVTNSGNTSMVDYKTYKLQQPSNPCPQQYSSQNFNWSPQYILNQINRSRSNPQQQNGFSEFCSTNAPYLSMRQNNSQRIGISSQNSLNYSRYSSGNVYGSTQPRYAILIDFYFEIYYFRLPNPTLSSDFVSQRYSKNYRFYK